MTTAAALETARRDLLLRTFTWLIFAFTILLPVAILRDFSTRPWTVVIHGAMYVVLGVSWLQRNRLSSSTIAMLVLGTLYGVGTVGLLRTGVVGINGMAYGLLVIAAPLLFGTRAGAIAAAICGITYALIGFLTVGGILTFDTRLAAYVASTANWIHTGAAFAGFVTIAVVMSGSMYRKLHELLRSEAARSQMLSETNARLAEANDRLRNLNVELEQRIAERTRCLEQANQELESFSYTVSHDLRSPLQVIEGFSALALQEEGSGLSVKSRDYLHRIQSGTRRMHDMIGQLLKFSQLGGTPVRCEPVNLTELAQRILHELKVTEPGRQVAVQIEPDLLDTADPELIGNVLHNLLGNAWKFSSRTDAAHIEFSRSHGATGFVYSVRDNGVGFDACASQRLFQPFVRLHNKREFQGSGVGLATAKRIIERHGGRIWAESRPSEGATFFFTLG